MCAIMYTMDGGGDQHKHFPASSLSQCWKAKVADVVKSRVAREGRMKIVLQQILDAAKSVCA